MVELPLIMEKAIVLSEGDLARIHVNGKGKGGGGEIFDFFVQKAKMGGSRVGVRHIKDLNTRHWAGRLQKLSIGAGTSVEKIAHVEEGEEFPPQWRS